MRCNGYSNQRQTNDYVIYANYVSMSNLGPVLQC